MLGHHVFGSVLVHPIEEFEAPCLELRGADGLALLWFFPGAHGRDIIFFIGDQSSGHIVYGRALFAAIN
jgi:hypothetical protein